MVAVVGIAVISIFALMYWSAMSSDRSAAESEKSLMKGALQIRQDYLVQQQKGATVWDKAFRVSTTEPLDLRWIRTNMTNWLYKHHGFTRAMLVDDKMNVTLADDLRAMEDWDTSALLDELRPVIAKVQDRFEALHRITPTGLYAYTRQDDLTRMSIAETGIVAIENQPYLFSAAAIIPQIQSVYPELFSPAVLVSFLPMDEDIQGAYFIGSEFQDLRLVQASSEPAKGAFFPLLSPAGNTVAYLTWTPGAPGSQMMDRIFPHLSFLALMIAFATGAAVIFIRQTTRRLAQSEAKAVHTSRHDSLSGLPNRARFSTLFEDTLKQVKDTGQLTCAVYLDIDHFKDINDTLGHAVGDEVIVTVANRLKSALPTPAVVARISGDEFAMQIPDCRDYDAVKVLLDAVQDEIARPMHIANKVLNVSVSMGAAFAPDDGVEPDELVRKADIALYDAKLNGRGRSSFFEPAMEEQVQSRDKLSRELRGALGNGELHLAYQPQADRQGNRFVTVEALARWERPDGSVVPPARFIPVAEETGLIRDLGLWVLKTACRDAHRWPDMAVAVNISPTQFKHPRFVENVMAILKDNDLPPHRLEIEVTESVFAGRNAAVLSSLRQLKELGVKVALDDFGSGYSSLSYLRCFPFDTIKIDRGFVSDVDSNIDAQNILLSIIQLGKALGMTVVAEGIETYAQLSFLMKNGCDRLQGFHLARPMRASELEEFVQDRRFADGPVTISGAMPIKKAV